MFILSQLSKILRFEEGIENYPYYDSLGYPTIGVGKKIGSKHTLLEVYDFSIPDDVAEFWVNSECKDLAHIISTDNRTKNSWNNCNDARKDMLISMAYQMGFEGLCKFVNMLAAINIEDFDNAANEMLDSRWDKQMPNRSERHSKVMRSGLYDTYNGLIYY